MRIVALHGQMGIASDWDTHIKRLAIYGHHMEPVDLWNYLESRGLGLEEIGHVLNQEQEDGQILLGYSMGGRLALHGLLDQPQKWKGAVIISAHLGLPREERQARRERDDEWARKVEDLPWSEFLQEWNRQGVLGNDVMPSRDGLEDKKVEIARSLKCWSLAEQEDLAEELVKIEIPVLWVVGENDEKFCNQADRAGSKLKNAKILRISKSGHRVPWEAEAELVDAIAHFASEML